MPITGRMSFLMFSLALLTMLGPFSVDTFFPSFPALAEHFGVGISRVQDTLSFYVTALAAMSLFHGALSDSFGRRRIVLVTLSVYVLACIGCVFAPTFGVLLFFRTLQGLTAGAGFTITQAMVRDLHKGHEAQKLMAKIMIMFSFAPAVAPILGGYLHVWFGWRGPFSFLVFYGLMTLILTWKILPETLNREHRHEFHPMTLIRLYLMVLRNRRFLLFGFANALCFGAFCVYVTDAPDFILNILHLKETQFGWLFIPIVIGIVTGSFFSHRLAGKVETDTIIKFGYIGMISVAVINFCANIFFSASVPWAVIPVGAYIMISSMLSPVLALKALDCLPHNRGLAASAMSFITLLIFAVVSSLVTPYVRGSALGLSAVMLGLLCVNRAFYYLATRREA